MTVALPAEILTQPCSMTSHIYNKIDDLNKWKWNKMLFVK